MDLENKITHILEDSGPLTGAQLTDLLPEFTNIAIWRQCYSSDKIRVSNCARYYLRYDITRGNQLRLSPSICLLYTSPSPRDRTRSRMPSSA